MDRSHDAVVRHHVVLHGTAGVVTHQDPDPASAAGSQVDHVVVINEPVVATPVGDALDRVGERVVIHGDAVDGLAIHDRQVDVEHEVEMLAPSDPARNRNPWMRPDG